MKEIGVSFLLKEELKPIQVIDKLKRIIELIKMKINSITINRLSPGFDILIGLKESCCYFGFWGETQYVRMFLSSCKQFDEEKVVKFIKKHFKIKSKVRMEIITDCSIKDEVEDLCQERY